MKGVRKDGKHLASKNGRTNTKNLPFLLQKNPQAIRTAEEKRDTEMLSMNIAVNLTRTWQLSAHIHNMCSVAREAVYTREADVRHWLDRGKHAYRIP